MSNYYLPTALRRTLEKTAKDARIVAEDGARDAIRRLGVADSKAPTHLSDDDKELRRRLRAHARALGDAFDKTGNTQETKRLVEAGAYAHWHRMLFARFLAERGLLRNPEYDVPVSLEDCRELAEAEGLPDAWAIAERYAASMLPAVFRIEDPVLALELDPVHTQKLHRLVTGLDAEIFQAEDSLGWTYQFWRAAEKDAVNSSGMKIGADELPAVTQLFTEPYMVRFLLHNTLGAWWAGKVLAANPALGQSAADENSLRVACSLPNYSFDMLRFVREGGDGPWRPAAGIFPGWPKEAKAITVLDPCCGSGHFLTEALSILTALRQADEQLSPAHAVAAALRDNLHGLEIDGRCVQIAAFAVALTGWRIAGWQTLPVPQIAWVGAPPPLPKHEFVGLANGDVALEYALSALHDLFADAPILGSLIEPIGSDLFEAEKMKQIERLLEQLIEKVRRVQPEKEEGVIAARGMADAAAMLHKRFVLQITNVPFLGRAKQTASLSKYVAKRFPNSKPDLATSMVSRIRNLANNGGSIAYVSPQTWLYLKGFKNHRAELLLNQTLNVICPLGTKAFDAIGGEVVNACLCIETILKPKPDHHFFGVDAYHATDIPAKIEYLLSGAISNPSQGQQYQNPDHIISLEEIQASETLGDYFDVYEGLHTGDYPQFGRSFWEVKELGEKWEYQQAGTRDESGSGGCEAIIFWERGNGRLIAQVEERLQDQAISMWIKGTDAWGKQGFAISKMSGLKFVEYHGAVFTHGIYVAIPKKPEYRSALKAYLDRGTVNDDVRKIDRQVAVSRQAIARIPFSLAHWANAAMHEYPKGLLDPFSSDPTQWLFHGHPCQSVKGTTLQVALARLCGYRWPAEIDTAMRLSEEARAWIAKAAELPTGDDDGLLGVPAVAGENSLADRLRAYLAAAFRADWSDDMERRLVTEADEVLDKKTARDGSLDAWVRDRAFRQHCALFGQRPFLWHISDGLKDGFSVFVHYHRFNRANLRKLTYTLLGDWLARAKAENNALRYEKGRELQQMLEKVLEGEKPYDIFVRWKSLAQQPLGWDPDLEDGVRQNIRPFIKAGLLTHDLSKILKDKDRGADVKSAPWYPVFEGERRNDHHTSLAEKRSARDAMK